MRLDHLRVAHLMNGKELLTPGLACREPKSPTDGNCPVGGSGKEGRHTMIKLKRFYEPARSSDGTRYLVERLWPRGMKKAALRIDAWLKEVAPSTTLRRWFNHDPKKWGEFQRRYRRELNANPDALRPIFKAAQRGNVTLVYSSHDAEHNNAVVLKGYVEEKLAKKPGGPLRKSAA